MSDLDEEHDDYPGETVEEAEPSDDDDLDEEEPLDAEEEESFDAEAQEPAAQDPEAVFLKALGRVRATDTAASSAYRGARKAWIVYKTASTTTRADLMKVYASAGWAVLRSIYDRTPERRKAKAERDARRWVRTGKAKRQARRVQLAIARHSRVVTGRLTEIVLVGGDLKSLVGSMTREAVRQALKRALDGLTAGEMPEERVQFVVRQFESTFGRLPTGVLEAARAARKKETTS